MQTPDSVKYYLLGFLFLIFFFFFFSDKMIASATLFLLYLQQAINTKHVHV